MKDYIPFVEKEFGKNDMFILFVIFAIILLFTILPKRIPKSLTVLLLLYSLAIASLFDNSMGVSNHDYYDILDGPKYTIMDLLAYSIYLPFGYLFYYFYEKYNIHGLKTVGFILVWVVIGLSFEWLCVQFNVFTYKNGYKIIYSAPIYLFALSSLMLFIKYITKDTKAYKQFKKRPLS